MNSKKNDAASVFAHRNVDACVAIEVREDGLILIDFLAKGRSQRRKDGKVVGYTKRNPERTALAKHILEALSDDGFVAVAWSSRGILEQHPEGLCLTQPVKSAHSRAGNFRWSLYVKHAWNLRRGRNRRSVTAHQLAEQLGLVEREHRPVKTSWPQLVASLAVTLTSVLVA